MQRGEVEYSLRLVPLGGYVAFPDDDPESPYPKGELGTGDEHGRMDGGRGTGDEREVMCCAVL